MSELQQKQTIMRALGKALHYGNEYADALYEVSEIDGAPVADKDVRRILKETDKLRETYLNLVKECRELRNGSDGG